MRTLMTFVAAMTTTAASWGAEEASFQIEVSDTGASPRTLLIYEIEPGARETMTMSTALDQNFEIGEAIVREMTLPMMTMTVELTAAEEPAAGEVEAAYELGEVTFSTREGVPDGLLERMKAGLAGFDTVSGRIVMTREGRLKTLSVDANPDTPAAVRESLEQTISALRGAITPLPGVPVGIGATWTVTMDIPFSQFTMRQAMTYTLVKVEGELVTLRVSAASSAPDAGDIKDIDDEWNNEISEVSGSGSGTVVLSLDQFSPVRSDVSTMNRVVVDSTRGDATSQTTVSSKTRVTTEGVKR